MPTITHKLIAVCAVSIGASGLFYAQTASAQSAANYPGKTIRLVVPFTPGGSTDILARAIGQKLNEAWGQPVVIENVPGAGGSIGADRVAKAPADGYTLLMGHIGTLAVNPSLYPNLPYDPIKSFAPVAWVARVPNVLVVHPSVPAKSVKELVALAKSKPGQLTYGSAGNGSSHHLAGELFKMQTKTFITHIPYRGAGPALQDLMAGSVDMMFDGLGSSAAHIKGGRIKALMVSGTKRNPAFPDVPCAAELGLPDYTVTTWYGLWAPRGTPPEVVEKMGAELKTALNSPELKTAWNSIGSETPTLAGKAFGDFVAAETQRWAEVVKAGHIKMD